MLESLSVFAVPPVLNISTPFSIKLLENSTTPVLSYTEIRARSIFILFLFSKGFFIIIRFKFYYFEIS